MKETDSKKTHISDPGDLMKMIGSVAVDAVLSSESDMEDGEAKQSVRDEQDPEEVCKNLQKEIVFYVNSKEYTKNPEDNISDGEHLPGSGEIEQQSFADLESMNELVSDYFHPKQVKRRPWKFQDFIVEYYISSNCTLYSRYLDKRFVINRQEIRFI